MKQLKQTELFRNKPKQSGIFWKIPKYALVMVAYWCHDLFLKIIISLVKTVYSCFYIFTPICHISDFNVHCVYTYVPLHSLSKFRTIKRSLNVGNRSGKLKEYTYDIIRRNGEKMRQWRVKFSERARKKITIYVAW